MAFSNVTITHAWPATVSGTVTFTLTQDMTNGAQTYPAGLSWTAAVSSGTAIAVSLPANNDPATVPAMPLQANYVCTIRLTNVAPQTYFVMVPAGAGSVDLYTLIPSLQQVS